MSRERQVAVRDLVEEAKKRIVFLVICVVGLSYLMSLTSASVLVNLPAAAFLIIILRYLSLDFDMRKKAAAYSSKQSSMNTWSKRKLGEAPKVFAEKSDWRAKVDSPAVEDAMDQFTRHLVSEWMTDLWYSRVTPDKEGPEELVQIINGVLGEISHRAKNINLIDLLTRDINNLFCTHLELFRASQAKIESEHLQSLTIDQRDTELKLILATDNKLYPALISAEAEHKVLQHLMDGLISFTFKPEDLQCSFFRHTARELLACAVMRPVLNLFSPRFINQRIESLVHSVNSSAKEVAAAQEVFNSKTNASSKISSDHFSRFLDPSVTGVELVPLKNTQSQTTPDRNINGTRHPKDPLLLIDAQTTQSRGSLPSYSKAGDGCGIEWLRSKGEWGDVLDLMSHRKAQALAPEHFESMWAKGRNYRKESLIGQGNHIPAPGLSEIMGHSMLSSEPKEKDIAANLNNKIAVSGCDTRNFYNDSTESPSSSIISYPEDESHNFLRSGEIESGSDSSYTTEGEETSTVTGLDSPGTKVWDRQKNRNISVSHIRHPLESSEGHKARSSVKGHIHYQRLSRPWSGRKRSRLNDHGIPVWQEVQRTSLTSEDGQDILNPLQGHTVIEDSSDDSEMESYRGHSGAPASSSASISLPRSHSLTVDSAQNLFLADSFLRLRCEVLGANIVKSGSKMLAVYSISVADVNNHIWSIKRRFRHFEELHRRLKVFPQYNLHLPPKHFLSTGLDMTVIQERCKLLDKYLKSLLQLPTISGSIEVWDFLSVDSQAYTFSNSISIVETLSVDFDDKPPEKTKQVPNFITPVNDTMSSARGSLRNESMQTRHNFVSGGSRSDANGLDHSVTNKPLGSRMHDSSTYSDSRMQKMGSSKRGLGKTTSGRDSESSHGMLVDAASDPTLPTEWVPPNLSIPILDMVDVLLQLQDGGWIRRKVFWVAKQVLQLGMGDAFDDWLIEKIQLLRQGSVISSGIHWVEQVLWPDGIFITKHPQRQPPPSSANLPQEKMCTSSPREDFQKQRDNGNGLSFDEQQKQEAEQRAKFVYDLMIENAPTAIVGLIGRKEYEQCAKDLYFFIQSSVFLKQVGFSLLELMLLAAFPELDNVVAQVHEEGRKFG